MAPSMSGGEADLYVWRAPVIVNELRGHLSGDARFRPMFGACERLAEFLWRHRPTGIAAGPEFNRAELVVWPTFFRSHRTFSAAVMLCDAGYGTQAAMLARSSFEDAVVSQWAVTNAVMAGNLFTDHLEHTRELYREALQTHELGLPEALEMLPPLRDAERSRLDGEFGSHGGRLWTKRSLYQMIEELRAAMSDEDHRTLRQMYDTSQRINNLLLHHGPFALNQPLTVGASEQGISHALHCGHYSFSLVGRLIVRGESDLEHLDRMTKEDSYLFAELDERDLASARRNDPCPDGRLSWHSLRYSFASLLATDLEVPATTLARVTGHSDPGFTLKLYARDARDETAVVADVLARAAGAGIGG